VIVVVTGGSGQLGTLVLSRLIGSRKVKRVIALDSLPPAVASPKLAWTIAHPGDPGLGRHFEGADALIYLGFVPPAEPCSESEAQSGRRLFREAIGGGIHHLLFGSSIASYGIVAGHPSPVFESSQRKPGPALSGSAHFELEQALDELEPRHPALRVVRLRPGIALGPRFSHSLGRALRRRMVPKLGDARWPIVWDGDVADAVLLALLSEARGAFNLVADEPLDAAGLARAGSMVTLRLPGRVLERLGRIRSVFGRIGVHPPSDDAWLEAQRTELVVSSARARAELGWRPSCPTADSVIRRFVEEVPRRVDRRVAVFMRMAQSAAERVPQSEIPEDARHLALTLHLNLTGPGGGDFQIRVSDGRPSIGPGIPRPLDAVVTMRAETLLEMLSGELDLASARFSGKVKVQGEPFAGFVVSGFVTSFRRSTTLGGARGAASRKLEAWFKRAHRPSKSANSAPEAPPDAKKSDEAHREERRDL